MEKKVSVIMSTYREPIEWVVKCIESVVNQTVKPFEYIIVVDAPDNYEMVEMLHKYESNFSFIKVVINDVNVGLVGSLNRALSLCTGDYIARIDADDIAYLERLEKQLKYMDDMGYDIVGAGYNIFFNDKVRAKIYGKTNDKLCKALLKYSNCMAHPTWLIKSEVYKNLNGYRDIDACEDLDFLIRAAISGYKMGCVEEQLLWYRDNPNSISHEKNNKQKAIQIFLCENYRKHREVSYDMYKCYINSSLYKRRVNSLNIMLEYKNLNDTSMVNKFFKKIRRDFNRDYLIQSIVNQKIKMVNKLYG